MTFDICQRQLHFEPPLINELFSLNALFNDDIEKAYISLYHYVVTV